MSLSTSVHFKTNKKIKEIIHQSKDRSNHKIRICDVRRHLLVVVLLKGIFVAVVRLRVWSLQGSKGWEVRG